MRLNDSQIATVGKMFQPRELQAFRSIDPGIHAIAIGLKRRGKAQDPTPDDAVIFFVERKQLVDAVPSFHRIPDFVEVVLDGRRTVLPTDVAEAPMFEFAACTTPRPTQGGNCIAPVRSGIRGTLGGIVMDPQGHPYIVSASHVLSNYGTMPVGHSILHPHTGSAIATLDSHGVRWPSRPGPMDADVALAKVTTPADVDGQVIGGIGTPTGQRDAATAMEVEVMGSRMTRPRRATIAMFYPSASVRQLVNVYIFSNVFVTPRLSLPGDSGSLAVDAATGNIVGLLFAHNNQYSVFLSMREILQTLRIDSTWSWGVSRMARPPRTAERT